MTNEERLGVPPRIIGAKLSDRDLANIKLSRAAIIAHYQDEIVSRAIIAWSQYRTLFRAGNMDKFNWYKEENGMVRLWVPSDREDYEYLIKTGGRTLYTTLNLFEQELKYQTRPSDEENKRLGTFKDCGAYTLGVDIDGKGEIWQPNTKKAVEAMAQFYADKFRETCPTSVYAAFSGGGIYILIHHAIFAKTFSTDTKREYSWRMLTGCFNAYVKELEEEFFKKYPEHKEKVKADAINNQKRLFKSLFSVHSRYPFAVIPLDTVNIKINLADALIPLRDEIKKGGLQWMK